MQGDFALKFRSASFQHDLFAGDDGAIEGVHQGAVGLVRIFTPHGKAVFVVAVGIGIFNMTATAGPSELCMAHRVVAGSVHPEPLLVGCCSGLQQRVGAERLTDGADEGVFFDVRVLSRFEIDIPLGVTFEFWVTAQMTAGFANVHQHPFGIDEQPVVDVTMHCAGFWARLALVNNGNDCDFPTVTKVRVSAVTAGEGAVGQPDFKNGVLGVHELLDQVAEQQQ